MRRPILVLLAFVTALLVAGLVLALGVVAPDIRGLDSDRMERVRFFASAFFASGYGPAVALLLSIAAIALAEAAHIRSVLYYGIAGALIGLAAAYNVDLSDALENTTDIAPTIFGRTIATTSGIAGGLVYWWIMHRNAGRWRSEQVR